MSAGEESFSLWHAEAAAAAAALARILPDWPLYLATAVAAAVAVALVWRGLEELGEAVDAEGGPP